MKKIKALVLFLAAFALVGCASNTTKKTDETKESKTVESSQVESKTRTFVDSAGRKVEIPTKIEKIAPSGSVAQIMLYTAAPDMLVGLANDVSDDAKPFLDKKFQELPIFGQFYGKNASLNMEALSAADPDLVIDIGEAKDTVKEDMDKLQDQLSILTVFIEANLENTAEAYRKLGELLGNEKETEKLAKYSEKVLKQAEDARKKIGDDKKSVYYASGDAGLNTNAEGSFHAQVIDAIGAKNAATGVEVVSKGSGTVVSMEQLIVWQPDYIIVDTKDVYDMILSDASWKELTAVKDGKVYLVPSAPYNFMSFPPSVNRIIGIEWLGNLIYPEEYDYKIEDKVKEFYELFYHTKVSDEQVKELLNETK